ncbi:MAG TPA: 1-acyl-sn-glycerol-3-phosphate acyltransferase [Oscillospiraceae bacterium]|nr:1-acyl-sn-glycerol-3-phosphate acyltransferase [Oscillospiraceae bacterium]HPF55556.1 1-acyl-sn-glycerol-3-phosphate acyltransferase [Clostridiales bacterium]HPK34657.1 1-acyl-sn-glycerol-3-phosphate acyltransferase [Oscillospiraceae bacterium]HPR74578.1 1-acyl-sn-glycerol-3-phosphate acyltransferase [Oscillospiraceae bacterium]
MKLTESSIKRHRKLFRFLKRIAAKLFVRSYNITYETPEFPPAPYIVVANHNADLDPALLGITMPQMYFVASEHIFENPVLGALLEYVFSPIARKKGSVDASTVLEMRRRLKQGCNVCIFPEGNKSLDGRTGPLYENSGKLVRALGVPLVTFKLSGGFLTTPRWAFTKRRGKMTGKVVNVYSSEQLKQMTDNEASSAIYTDIFVDAYADQESERVAYKGRRLAEGLETALFLCPACGKMGRLTSKNDEIFCECGMHAEYDEYGYFSGSPEVPETFTAWYDFQMRELESRFPALPEQLEMKYGFVKLYRVGGKHSRFAAARGQFHFNRLGLSICKGDQVKFNAPLSAITSIEMHGRNTLVLTADGVYYEIKAEKRFNARLPLYLYKLYKQEN